jgi:hypothetical protein
MPRNTPGELITILIDHKYLFLINVCFPLSFNKARSVVVLGVLAGFLGWFRTREQVWESLDHFDAYLFLYAFNLMC